jgi:protein SCO1/2
MFVKSFAKRFASALKLISFVIAAACVVIGCDSNTLPAGSTTSSESNSNWSFAVPNSNDALPDVTLVDQYGRNVNLASLKGRPVLVDFFYANCATACPLLTAKFAAIARMLGAGLGSKVTIVSITIDPEHDHPAELLAYARTHQADYKGWLFLTGKPDDVMNVMRAYGLRRERDASGQISHVATSFLIGRDGHQTRIYDALEVRPTTVIADVDRIYSRS